MELNEYFPMWDKLTSAQQSRLLSASDRRSYKKGQIVHNGMTDCTGLFLIQSGQLRAYTISDEGREITVYRLFERDICLFSASCMIRSIQFDIVIEAEKDTEIRLIQAEAYKKVMEESASLANYTNEIMASRFSDVMWLMDQIMWKSLDRRLAEFLLEESLLENTSKLKITHEIIGNHLGTAREVVTRMLRYFQSEGMVKLSRGTVELTDMDKLKKLNS
ncbi:MAG: Crp/Fnr family transcriptional regulator [Clostridiales bacterium]|nr:Crp/Fnr family transcriptional regulator [Clostridiales bacterium]